jgi:hypothetical protein
MFWWDSMSLGQVQLHCHQVQQLLYHQETSRSQARLKFSVRMWFGSLPLQDRKTLSWEARLVWQAHCNWKLWLLEAACWLHRIQKPQRLVA